ncbi:STAS domain-containing protein [Marinomonas mediterranea]|uniref:STAS domain-containing protein n=1 Tax=Marinomonas mediterranea TaxID=119864 RepID=UPI002349B24C|nr:STAS domain-containing protein [Marinomonas mediterranea]WCN08428.1 STAS domain-containing protein [Marinomonas mediterranea]
MSDFVIRIPERFDFSTHKWFTAEYENGVQSGSTVILDFSNVLYVDSSALGMMVLLYRKLHECSKKGIIKNLDGTAKDILDMANFKNLYQYE